MAGTMLATTSPGWKVCTAFLPGEVVFVKRDRTSIQHGGDPIQFEPRVTSPTAVTKDTNGNPED